jgi:hypothetical protein
MDLCSFIERLVRPLWRTSLAAVLSLGALTALAFETDNFCLPLEGELADIGDFLEAAHTLALQEAVAEVNARIEKALQIKGELDRTAHLHRLHRPQALVNALIPKFGYPLFEDTQLERCLRSEWSRKSYPGKRTSHQDLRMQASSYFPLDPRWLTVLSQSRTVKAFGVYFGTDKIVHFHALGSSYCRMYLDLLEDGLPEKEAWQKVIAHHASRGVFSEASLFGSMLTGVYSNADMAANQAGFKFLVNLTQSVCLKGQERDPLVVRCGVFWRLNQHVRLRSGWFGLFISDHWNEALNPCHYDVSRQPGVRRFLQNHARHIVQFYTDKDGRPHDPAYFDNLARELCTHYGESYGHSGDLEHLLTIGNTCFPALR